MLSFLSIKKLLINGFITHGGHMLIYFIRKTFLNNALERSECIFDRKKLYFLTFIPCTTWDVFNAQNELKLTHLLL